VLDVEHGRPRLGGDLGLALTIGVVSGIAINTAHELGHKKDELERWLSKIALAQTGYGHFYLEHNRGHHVRVATPEDPASSRLGESFWAFWPRTVVGSLRSSWELETKRFERLGTSRWSLRNDVLNAWAMTVVLFAVLLVVFGPSIAPVAAAAGRVRLLAAGGRQLPRALRPAAPEDRERPLRAHAPRHSWNSNNTVSNVFLYHLQRHSDHHANPTRRYQALRSMDDAPQLPVGLREHDRAGLPDAAVAPGDGPAAARAPGRRRHEGQHPAEPARAVLARYGAAPESGRRQDGVRSVA
jgi:alkane 1-monooxygenase